MATKQLPLRVDDEQRARWQAAADDAGYDLSSFIRSAVDHVIAEMTDRSGWPRKALPKPAAPPDNPSNVGGKRTYEPDFKKGKGK